MVVVLVVLVVVVVVVVVVVGVWEEGKRGGLCWGGLWW